MPDDFSINANGAFYSLNIAVVLETHDTCCSAKMNKLLNSGISSKISFIGGWGIINTCLYKNKLNDQVDVHMQDLQSFHMHLITVKKQPVLLI